MKKVIIYITLLLPVFYGNAQQAFTNSGNLQIHTGASVSGFGNFTNASSGVLINNGNFYAKGTITNDQSSMTVGTGTLHVNGSSAQIINGSQPFYTFNLVSDNTAGITLNSNLHVSGAHTFTNGIITTSATPNYLVYESGSSHSGSSDANHVNGWVKKIGNTSFVFPVGNGTVERTIAMNSLSASSEFNVRYAATTPNYAQMLAPVWSVDQVEYWTVNRVSGGTAALTLNWDYSKVYFPNYIIPDILVTGYNGSLWTDNGGAGTASGNATTTGTVTSGTISTFNRFTFGSRTYVLAMSLINFSATRTNNYTQLTWTTDKETNEDRFVVERSDDGVSFYSISQTPARNRNTREYYSSRDNAAINGVAYYRLRCINKDGREKLSQTVMVTEGGGDAQITLLTNPVYDKIGLMADSRITGDFTYRINALGGQLMQQGKLMIQNGGQYQLPLKADLSKGLYLLEITNELQTFRYKIIVR